MLMTIRMPLNSAAIGVPMRGAQPPFLPGRTALIARFANEEIRVVHRAERLEDLVPRAVGAAVRLAVRLHPVADDPHVAPRADGCERLDCAFEAVESMRLPLQDHLEALVVPADFTTFHFRPRAPLPLPLEMFTGYGPGGRLCDRR